jgi:glutamate-1-semialdehyde 2,1-aminomutase
MNHEYTHSAELMERARQVIPGGVNSPVRALRSTGGVPFFARGGHGPNILDEDGHPYVDYVLSYGPLILGHAHPKVVEAVQHAASGGLSFGAPTRGEIELAELICEALPSVDKVRLVNSGTEATMSAIRVARGFTGRDLIVKFTGCYHGHADHLLVKAGSGLATFGVPDSLGVPGDVAKSTLTLPYNDAAAVRALFADRGCEIAALIVEPVAGNMGCVPPVPGFLETLREVCTASGTVLIFDEVMTGFRLSWQSAQGLYGIEPDMTCLGKVIGGGMPVGAYGGRAEIMDVVSPLGGVYQAGTLSGNPLSVAAGIATLKELQDGEAYGQLEAWTARLAEGLERELRGAGVPGRVQRVGSMFTLFFTDAPIHDIAGVDAIDKARFAAWFHGMRDRGVSLPPSQYEACFTSIAHGDDELERTLEAARQTLSSLR